MIDFIYGKVEYKGQDHIVINCNNIGYKIFVSKNTLFNAELYTSQKVYTDMVVREDDISLFGFYDQEERRVYKLLTTVKGIGPKMALGIFSGMDISTIISSIRNNDSTTLTKAPGIGKKTAERIILELKDKTDDIVIEEKPLVASPVREAEEALLALGYLQYEIKDVIDSNYKDGMTVEEIIRVSLKQMTR